MRLPGLFGMRCSEARPPKIFLIHIMKTGGTSVREALAPLYPPKRCLFETGAELRKSSEIVPPWFVSGHLVAWQAFDPRFDGFLKLVVLRDPLERFKSHYRHLRWLKAQGSSTSGDIDAAATSGVREFFYSRYGRLLRHYTVWQLGLNRSEYCLDLETQLQAAHHGRHPPFDELVVRVKTRLDRCFVAIQEELALSLRVFARTHLARDITAQHLHETPPEYRAESELLSFDDIAKMRAVLEPDYEIYHHALDRLRLQLAACNASAEVSSGEMLDRGARPTTEPAFTRQWIGAD